MLGFGLTVAAIGMGTVFVELILLVFVIYLISAVAKSITGKKSKAGQAPAVGEIEEPVVVQAQTDAAQDEDDTLIAVIAAAISSYTQDTVRIHTIRRITGIGAPAWSHAGRQEVMNVRQF